MPQTFGRTNPLLIGRTIKQDSAGAWVKYGVKSPMFFWAPVYSCTHWLRPCNFPPPPAFGLIYEGAIGQPR